MSDEPNADDGVRIIPPDLTLKKKLGGTSLDRILSPQAVEAAQQVIAGASDQFLEACVAEVDKLELAVQKLAAAPDQCRSLMREVIDFTFSLKANAGLGGYDLISLLAKSCHQRGELLSEAGVLMPATLLVLKWYVESLKRMLAIKVKGMGGGAVGVAILAELKNWMRAV